MRATCPTRDSETTFYTVIRSWNYEDEREEYTWEVYTQRKREERVAPLLAPRLLGGRLGLLRNRKKNTGKRESEREKEVKNYNLSLCLLG